MSRIVRFAFAVEVEDEATAKRLAVEMAETNAGLKLQNNVAHIIAAGAGYDEVTPVESETLVHVCDFYDQDDCSICRFSSGFSLARTQSRI